jgi:hypothetical protein
LKGFLKLLGKRVCVRDVGLLAQLVEKKLVNSVKMGLLPPALGEIGPQYGCKLGLVQTVNQLQLIKAVKHFRG